MSCDYNRKNLVKKVVHGKGSNVAQQRTKLRNNFIERLKSLRIREFDKFRQIKGENLDYQCLIEIRKILSHCESTDLITQDLTLVLEDVEKEILQIEAEQQEKYTNEEVEAIAENLMSKCRVCDSLNVAGDICEICQQVHFSSPF